jgi:hypothetical protein
MRLSVPAARNGGLVINIVLTTAASVSGNIDFILILSFVVCVFVLNTRDTLMDPSVFRYGV